MAPLSFGRPHRRAASQDWRGRRAEPGPGYRTGGSGGKGAGGRGAPGRCQPITRLALRLTLRQGPGRPRAAPPRAPHFRGPPHPGTAPCPPPPAASAPSSAAAFGLDGRGCSRSGGSQAGPAALPRVRTSAHLPLPASSAGRQHPPATRAWGVPRPGAPAPPIQSTFAARGRTAAPGRQWAQVWEAADSRI